MAKDKWYRNFGNSTKKSYLCMTVKVPKNPTDTVLAGKAQIRPFWCFATKIKMLSNLSNCGIFSTAFAYSLSKSHPPELCIFNGGRLRAQLYTVQKTASHLAWRLERVKQRQMWPKRQYQFTVFADPLITMSSCSWTPNAERSHPTCVNIQRTVIGNDQVWHCFNWCSENYMRKCNTH